MRCRRWLRLGVEIGKFRLLAVANVAVVGRRVAFLPLLLPLLMLLLSFLAFKIVDDGNVDEGGATFNAAGGLYLKVVFDAANDLVATDDDDDADDGVDDDAINGGAGKWLIVRFFLNEAMLEAVVVVVATPATAASVELPVICKVTTF